MLFSRKYTFKQLAIVILLSGLSYNAYNGIKYGVPSGKEKVVVADGIILHKDFAIHDNQLFFNVGGENVFVDGQTYYNYDKGDHVTLYKEVSIDPLLDTLRMASIFILFALIIFFCIHYLFLFMDRS